MVLVETAPATMVPPGRSRSTTATRRPKYAAWAAAFSPAGPDPTTSRSNRSPPTSGMRLHLAQSAAHPIRASAADRGAREAPSEAVAGSDVVVQVELPRVRAQPHGVDLVRPLVVDPGLDEVVGEHPAGLEEIVVGLQRVHGL